MSEKNNFKSMLLKYFLSYLIIIGIVFNIVVFMSEGGELDKLWTESMLFVNFGVLVFFYIRFAKKPLEKFLKGSGTRISDQLQEIEAGVKEARSRMEAEAERFRNINESLASITESIIAAGAREKENVIERARSVADKMIEDAKKEAEYKMLTAKKRFRDEMLEAAIKITAEIIKRNITREDDDRLINEFSSDLGSEQNLSL